MAKAQSGVGNLDFESWTSGYATGFIGTSERESYNPEHGKYFCRVNVTASIGSGWMLLEDSFTRRPSALSGYYRCYQGNPADTMAIETILKKSGKTIGYINEIIITKSDTSQWTSFTENFNYVTNDVPDSILMFFVSQWRNGSGRGGNVHASTSSYLDLDNFSFSTTTGIEKSEANASGISAFPNPAQNHIIIKSENPNARNIKVSDITGRCVGNYDIANGTSTIDASSYPNGIYIYTVSGKNNDIIYISKFAVSK